MIDGKSLKDVISENNVGYEIEQKLDSQIERLRESMKEKKGKRPQI